MRKQFFGNAFHMCNNGFNYIICHIVRGFDFKVYEISVILNTFFRIYMQGSTVIVV